MATLVELIRQIGWAGQPSPAPAGPAPVWFDQGEVVAVSEMGELTVAVGAAAVIAKPVTDEPFRVGAKVWVSASSGGYVVHGGVR